MKRLRARRRIKVQNEAVMVSQVDIVLLQGITQPEGPNQLVSSLERGEGDGRWRGCTL